MKLIVLFLILGVFLNSAYAVDSESEIAQELTHARMGKARVDNS